MQGLVAQVRQHPDRGLKFLVLMSCCLGSGLNFAILGPSLLDLKLQVDSTTSGISFLLTARALGAIIGASVCEYNCLSLFFSH